MTVLSMQIPVNIKSLSAYDIGQRLHKKKVWPIDLVDFYFNEIESLAGDLPNKVKNKEVVLRTLGQKNQEVLKLEEFIKKLKNSCRIS